MASVGTGQSQKCSRRTEQVSVIGCITAVKTIEILVRFGSHLNCLAALDIQFKKVPAVVAADGGEKDSTGTKVRFRIRYQYIRSGCKEGLLNSFAVGDLKGDQLIFPAFFG